MVARRCQHPHENSLALFHFSFLLLGVSFFRYSYRSNRRMRSATSVFFVLLSSFVTTRAFSPLRYGSALRVASLRPSTLLPTETPTREAADDDSDRSLSRLELEEGSLRVHSPDFAATDLLNGLSSSIWSASRAKDDDDSSLFLHTSHTQKKAEHEKTLGDLMACQRLLACSRK